MDELGEQAARILERARAARTPTSADRDRVRQALVARGMFGAAAAGTTVAATSSAAAATTAGAGIGALKVALMLGLLGATVGGALGGAYLFTERTPTGASADHGDGLEGHASEGTATEAMATEVMATEATATEAIATGTMDSSEASAIEASAIEGADSSEASVGVPAPVSPGAAGGDPAEASPRRARGQSGASSTARGRRAAPTGGSLAEEVALLHRAQAARRADPARALALVREHEARFRRSELRDERTALHVFLLCDRGQHAAAARLARPFLRRAAPSPLRRSVLESCAGAPH